MKTKELSWRQNWQREIEGAYLYGKLAQYARSPEAKQALGQMAQDEKRHAVVWAEHMEREHEGAKPPTPDLRVYIIEWLARLLGSEAVLGLMINDEVGDMASYSEQALELGEEQTYRKVLQDEASHARALTALKERRPATHAEPWHRSAAAGGMLREVVYGFNDGLTANFGLVMGVVGAAVNNNVILLAGFAGLLADALSMAASGFLAARSEQEVRQYHLALEQAELKMMPGEEREELAGTFARMGLTRAEALTAADRLMVNPEQALTQLARDELGIDPENPADPLREGIVTGIATGLGAIIPIIPFLLLSGPAAIWTGVVISMLAHFLVGASRAIFTGRPAIRSGFEMFAVGMGVALFTYLLGLALHIKF